MRHASPIFILFLLTGFPANAAEAKPTLVVTTTRALPAIESVIVYQAKGGKKVPILEFSKYDKPQELPHEGPYEIWAKPKAGIPVLVGENVAIKPSETMTVKLAERLGTIEIFGDNFPRASKLVVVKARDPGPGDKGHLAIQSANDYRVEMCVPAGTYDVWIVPANGGKPQRGAENIRVLAGRNVRVGEQLVPTQIPNRLEVLAVSDPRERVPKLPLP